MRFGHLLRWAEGGWESLIALLVEVAGVDEAVIRDLRYPDADRVMEAFLSMLPADIRNDISDGRIPRRVKVPVEQLSEEQQEIEEHETEQAHPILHGPGVSIPRHDRWL